MSGRETASEGVARSPLAPGEGAVVSVSTTIARVDLTDYVGSFIRVKSATASSDPFYIALGVDSSATITATAGTTMTARPDLVDPGERFPDFVVSEDEPYLLLECASGTATAYVQAS